MPVHDQEVFAARLDITPRIREFVGRACARAGIADGDRFAFELAVDEACTNIIEHGYGTGDIGQIALEFEADDTAARVTIVDTGRSFDPADAAPPEPGTDLLERPLGGLGILLIRKAMDEVHYRAEPSGNRLVLIKKLQSRSPVRPGRE
jgi:anti-sigma regulatory factor (Ser/Thr protein kinase)